MFSKNLKFRLPLVLFGSVLILSILVVGVNRGLYFSRYEPQIKVDFSGTTENTDTAIDALLVREGAIRVDRAEQSVYFQNVSEGQVEDYISTLKSDYSDLEISSMLINELPSYIGVYALIIVIITLATIFSVLYRILRLNSQTSTQFITHLIVLYSSIVGAANVILFGIISFLSRFYQIKELDLVALLIMNLYIAFSAYSYVWKLSYEAPLRDGLKILLPKVKASGYTHIQIISVMILLLAFALTPAFVIHGLLIIAGIIIAVFTRALVLDLYANGFKMKKLAFKKPKVLNRVNVVDGKELFKLDKPAEKKRKKKKKRKK